MLSPGPYVHLIPSVLLNIHRRYFSQALQDSPSDPLKHRYGPSVMAMYRSAWRLIVTHSSGVNCIPNVAARMPIFWSQALSAAVRRTKHAPRNLECLIVFSLDCYVHDCDSSTQFKHGRVITA